MKFITQATANSLREISERENIDQHKMPTSARQLWFYQLAIKPVLE
ncbi:MAG TPA: hypothetical protein VGI25_05740 [Candidatus Udaeobacter sp.]